MFSSKTAFDAGSDGLRLIEDPLELAMLRLGGLALAEAILHAEEVGYIAPLAMVETMGDGRTERFEEEDAHAARARARRWVVGSEPNAERWALVWDTVVDGAEGSHSALAVELWREGDSRLLAMQPYQVRDDGRLALLARPHILDPHTGVWLEHKIVAAALQAGMIEHVRRAELVE